MSFQIMRTKEQQKDSFSVFPDDSNIQHIQEASDMAQTIKELNDDKIERPGFSRIDLKSRLSRGEISAITRIDALVSMNAFPIDMSFLTMKIERLNVSADGKGRQEIVEISKGIQGQQHGSSIIDGIGKMFGGGRTQ